MSLPFTCVLIAGVMPYLLIGIAKFGAREYDHHRPREYMEAQSGWRLRAYWAHQNGFESFPLFAAAVIIAHLNQVHPPTLNGVCLGFLGFRTLHAFFYLFDWATLRTMSWVGSLACIFYLFTAG